ncbi:MAG: hypothetical protein D6701_13795 [Gemmatimonadetes bacterium]|nr:MAG: hypothetical protein D6701_13795 [Gemmatimonadota bacterium]
MNKVGRATTLAVGLGVCVGVAVGTAFSPLSGTAQALGTPPPALVEQAVAALEFRMVGPTRGGRVTAVAGHPATPGRFFMGATGGGVWRTDDYGQSWHNVSDGYFATGSIGAIRVAPSDPDRVYVGTGSDGIRSNVIPGRGVYRSDDGGRAWTLLGLEQSGQIGAVEVHPGNPDLVYVAALGNAFRRNEERGVFRSRDGGSTWEKILFTSDSVGAIDLELHPTNPDIVYAALWRGERKPWTIISGMREEAHEDGIWRSEDGGDTWSYVPLDLPSGLIGKIDFAVSPADPDRVYALVETKEPEEGLYRSDDAGRTWRLVSNQRGLMDRPFYYTNVDVDPTDADVVYVSATSFWKSEDGGRSFQRASTPHGDNHDLWIDPTDPRVMIQSNDGGANVTRDGGRTWSTQLNQPTAELYQVDVDNRFPYWLYAGQQDNSTIMVPSNVPEESAPAGPEAYWKDVGGCETGPAVPKPDDPTIVYSNCKGRFGRYSHRTGQEKQYYVGAANMYGVNPAVLEYRFQRVVPIEVSPHDPGVVYHGSQYVHVTRDEGVTWERISPDLTAFRPERQVESGEPITRDITGEEHYSTLYVIEESPIEPGVIWTGANDGPVHVTRDGGSTWTDVTPPMPPEGRIQSIEVSRHRPGKAYVAAYRTLLGDFTPYMYRTEDYGASWTLLTDGANGIPADHPTRVVREDPEREGLLYAGTEFGMFLSFDDGATWQSFQRNLPVVPVTDIELVQGDLALSTMGRSFWVMDDLTLLRQLTAQVAEADAHLFQPRVTPRVRGGGFFGFGRSDAARPRYAEPGVHIDYALARAPQGEVVIEVLDAEGAVVAGFSSASGGYEYESVQEMRAPTTRRRGGPRAPARPGVHRLTWNFRAPGGAAGRGPMVPPGHYTIRLTVDGHTQSRPLEIAMDPRVEADGVTRADLEEQYRLNLRIRDAVAEANRAVAELPGLRSALERIAADAAGERAAEARRALEALEHARERLVTRQGGSYQAPQLADQLRYLYGMTSRADQKPGRDAYVRLDRLRAELDEVLAALAHARSLAATGEGGG